MKPQEIRQSFFKDKFPKKIIIKVGSSVVTNKGEGLDNKILSNLVKQISKMSDYGHQIILVSSGAIAEGISRLGWKKKPKEISKLQAAAAVGQVGLARAYEQEFKSYNITTAQVLITQEDFSNRKRFLNSKSTLSALLHENILTIVNENDTVATDEIKVGDNDTIASFLVNLVEANLLIILTDQNGLYSSNPSVSLDAKLMDFALASDKFLHEYASKSSSKFGKGGMLTKINASKIAARGGASTIIANGFVDGVLIKILRGLNIGTLIFADQPAISAKKQWLLNQLNPVGELVLDEGAVNAIQKDGKSLLPIGVRKVQGYFDRGDLVSCKDKLGTEIAKGLINYSSNECLNIIGLSSNEIRSKLGYEEEPELIHRDNLSLISSSS